MIGDEARSQMLSQVGRPPDCVVACVGGGSNAIGMFHLVGDKGVKIVGVEAQVTAWTRRYHRPRSHWAAGCPARNADVPAAGHGVGADQLDALDLAGLDYPGVGPEHAWLKDSGRAESSPSTTRRPSRGSRPCVRRRVSSPRSSRRTRSLRMELAKKMKKDEIVLLNLCGRGDKDMHTVARAMGVTLDNYAETKDKGACAKRRAPPPPPPPPSTRVRGGGRAASRSFSTR